jgi:hypothetical protein
LYGAPLGGTMIGMSAIVNKRRSACCLYSLSHRRDHWGTLSGTMGAQVGQSSIVLKMKISLSGIICTAMMYAVRAPLPPNSKYLGS